MGVSDDKNFSLSTPTNPCSKLTSSVEAKENHQTSPNLANHKKFSSKKNFMSPTISASSKAVAHRKKVLAERNGSEATEPTCARLLHRRSSSFDLKQGSVDMGAAVYSSTDLLTSRVKEMRDVEVGEDRDRSKPYDPVFNYCSPRPKFLLYKPDRRSEILQRYEMVESTSSESETGSEDEASLLKPTEQVNENAGNLADHDDDCKAEETVAQPDVEIDEKSVELLEEEVHERAEEEVTEIDAKHQSESSQSECGSPKLKHNASEANSEALGTEMDGESVFQSMENEEEDDGGFEEYEVERGWSLKRLLKLWFVMVAVGLSTLYVSSMNSPSVELLDEYWVVGSDLHGAPFSYENVSGSVIHDEIAKMGFEEASQRIMDEIVFRDYDNDIVETTGGNQEEDLGEVSDEETSMVADQIEATDDGMDSELTEVAHYASGEAVAEDADGTVDDELVNVEEAAPENHDEVAETVETQSQTSEASYVEMDGVADANAHNDATPEDTAVSEDSTGEELEAGDREVESSGALSKSGSDESLNNLYEAEVSEVSDPDLVDELTPTYNKGNNKATIFSIVFALLLALFGALGFQKLKRTTKPLVGKAVGVAEQDASIGQRGVKQLDPSEKTSLSQSFKNGLGAPRAELLSEFTVGEQEVSSYSLRTDCVDNREHSTYLFSQENVRMSAKLHAARTPVDDSHPAASGFSSTTDYPPYGSYSSQRRTRKELPTSSIESPSYGSFTTELMPRKKELLQEAPGLEKVVVTPVRRSSRIRGRMTPGSSQ